MIYSTAERLRSEAVHLIRENRKESYVLLAIQAACMLSAAALAPGLAFVIWVAGSGVFIIRIVARTIKVALIERKLSNG